jgi:signal transduction histidine kinase
VRNAGLAVIPADRALILEAIANLVDNAVKFAGPGRNVAMELGGTPVHPVVSVSDNGPGIAPDKRTRVFERFFRGDESRSSPGSGLGLNIVGAVAKLHGFAVRLDGNRPGCRIELHCWPGAGERVGERQSLDPATIG